MRKKMMAMAAVTAMMVSAGTGSVAMAAQENDDPSKWPVVKMEVVSSTGEEAKEQEIEDALNKYLVSIDAGVQADLVPLAFGDRATQLKVGSLDYADKMLSNTETKIENLIKSITENSESLKGYLNQEIDAIYEERQTLNTYYEDVYQEQ